LINAERLEKGAVDVGDVLCDLRAYNRIKRDIRLGKLRRVSLPLIPSIQKQRRWSSLAAVSPESTIPQNSSENPIRKSLILRDPEAGAQLL